MKNNNNDYLEAPMFKLELCLSSNGEVFGDIYSIPENKFLSILEEWNPEYQNTHKLLHMLREAKRLSEDLLGTLEKEGKAV